MDRETHNDTFGFKEGTAKYLDNVYYEDYTAAWAKFVTVDPQINAAEVETSGGCPSSFNQPNGGWSDADADVFRWYWYKQDLGGVDEAYWG